jgi:hypothetical protein
MRDCSSLEREDRFREAEQVGLAKKNSRQIDFAGKICGVRI